MSVCLEVKNLTKSIKGKHIVGGVSFQIEEGKIVGFVGPNGAGKTTTMRMIMGLISPDNGSVRICGHDVASERKKAMGKIAGIIEKPCFYKDFTGRDNLYLAADISEDADDDYIEEIIELLDMDDYIDNKARTYSLGMQQRLGIALALINRPKILILDEPLNGLDPIGMRELHQLFPKLAAKGTSILISSHILKEIEEDCDECIMIMDGSTVEIAPQEGESLEEAFFRITDAKGGKHRV
ncbi:MAG: ABC transporter ATP-binding protein [Ruminococcaceae bacterium]|nr:ABC transporter ATP-binding protein [Oscillospiraceae bacterium]